MMMIPSLGFRTLSSRARLQEILHPGQSGKGCCLAQGKQRLLPLGWGRSCVFVLFYVAVIYNTYIYILYIYICIDIYISSICIFYLHHPFDHIWTILNLYGTIITRQILWNRCNSSRCHDVKGTCYTPDINLPLYDAATRRGWFVLPSETILNHLRIISKSSKNILKLILKPSKTILKLILKPSKNHRETPFPTSLSGPSRFFWVPRHEEEQTVIGSWSVAEANFHGYSKMVKAIWTSEAIQATPEQWLFFGGILLPNES